MHGVILLHKVQPGPGSSTHRKGQAAMVDALLQGGCRACLQDRNKRGLTPLAEALLAGHAAVAESLLAQVMI